MTYSNLLRTPPEVEVTLVCDRMLGRVLHMRSFVVCVVCGRVIEPHDEYEYDVMESTSSHAGMCWLELKRQAAR